MVRFFACGPQKFMLPWLPAHILDAITQDRVTHNLKFAHRTARV
jgi:hypothetical protein